MFPLSPVREVRHAAAMTRPAKLAPATVDAWLAAHPGWGRDGEAIARRYTFSDFASALAFAVKVGMLAEKRDHHPDILVAWGKAAVLWTTHDAGGITELDLELAAATDGL
jgi:4a-hydroxytetrahydrobiopterin dehydratase